MRNEANWLVIASEAKQSSVVGRPTFRGLLRFARNDGTGSTQTQFPLARDESKPGAGSQWRVGRRETNDVRTLFQLAIAALLGTSNSIIRASSARV